MLMQRDYDRVPQMRLENGAAWETIRQELSNIRAFCRFALQFGNVMIPEWEFKIPQHMQQALGRAVAFTVDEHKRLSEALDRYVLPDTEDGRYIREWGINTYGKGQVKAPKNLDQNLEKKRRALTRFFLQIHYLCGARPGEMSSDEFGLRWKDITTKFVSVAPGKSRMISVIGMRGGKRDRDPWFVRRSDVIFLPEIVSDCGVGVSRAFISLRCLDGQREHNCRDPRHSQKASPGLGSAGSAARRVGSFVASGNR